MTVCSCCERRWPDDAGQGFLGCPCVDDYCVDCLLCDQHCQCNPPMPVVVEQQEQVAQAPH